MWNNLTNKAPSGIDRNCRYYNVESKTNELVAPGLKEQYASIKKAEADAEKAQKEAEELAKQQEEADRRRQVRSKTSGERRSTRSKRPAPATSESSEGEADLRERLQSAQLQRESARAMADRLEAQATNNGDDRTLARLYALALEDAWQMLLKCTIRDPDLVTTHCEDARVEVAAEYQRVHKKYSNGHLSNWEWRHDMLGDAPPGDQPATAAPPAQAPAQ
jgi:exonuclease VII large subunit